MCESYQCQRLGGAGGYIVILALKDNFISLSTGVTGGHLKAERQKKVIDVTLISEIHTINKCLTLILFQTEVEKKHLFPALWNSLAKPNAIKCIYKIVRFYSEVTLKQTRSQASNEHTKELKMECFIYTMVIGKKLSRGR